MNDFAPSDSNPLKLDITVGNPLLNGLFMLTRGALERFLHFRELNEIYAAASTKEGDASFVDKVLDVLNISYELSNSDREKIPVQGPVIVVSNHPFGAIDGIIMNSILLSVRPDVKVMANYLLGIFPALRDRFMLVDPFGGTDSIRSNIGPLRETIQWVRRGGMLGVFPAGEVSHLQLRSRRISDPQWDTTVARLVKKTKASVLPMFFSGCNSLLFHLSGLVHPRLRTGMLPREVLKKINKKVKVDIGDLIPHERLSRFSSSEEMVDYLRLRTYVMGKHEPTGFKRPTLIPKPPASKEPQPIAPQGNSDALAREVRSLPGRQLLAESRRCAVFYAKKQQIPGVLREIGRLREISFRQVGEGTGRSTDLDRFDDHYLHLFVWNKAAHEVCGAYRLGLTDEIQRAHGLSGLYTHTLFQYKWKFIEEIDPAIELGRFFVRPEYQGNVEPFMLLWKGIASFVASNPRYRMLFGPVSLNNKYHSLSRQIIVAFFRQNNHRTDLARLVKPRNPLKKKIIRKDELKTAVSLLKDIRDLSELVSDIERDHKGIPILFKHYVNLGGKFVGYNVDPDFSDVLDALILVDLRESDRRILGRYMGKEGLEAFLRHHNTDRLAHCA